MAARFFKVEYEFTSVHAYGDNYTRRAIVKAMTAQEAITIARIEGFSLFGARFTDNCVDWRVVGA